MCQNIAVREPYLSWLSFTKVRCAEIVRLKLGFVLRNLDNVQPQFTELRMLLTLFCTCNFSPFWCKKSKCQQHRVGGRERGISEFAFELLCFHCVLHGCGSQSCAKPLLLRASERQSYGKTKTQLLKYKFSCYSFVLPGVN